MRTNDDLYYRRVFLNRPGVHAGAYVLATVAKDGPFHSIVMSDCSRVIRLEFDHTTAAMHRNSLRKADLLIETLTDFRAALVVADAAGRRRR